MKRYKWEQDQIAHMKVKELAEMMSCKYYPLIEPRQEKTRLLHYAKSKAQISCAVTAQLISAFVFATWIVQFHLYLFPKFQASSLLCLYRPLCVRPGRKPRRLVFSHRGSIIIKSSLLVFFL